MRRARSGPVDRRRHGGVRRRHRARLFDSRPAALRQLSHARRPGPWQCGRFSPFLTSTPPSSSNRVAAFGTCAQSEGLGHTVDGESEKVLRAPDMTVPRAVASEPKCAFDSAQIEPFWRLLFLVEWPGDYRDGPGRSAALRLRLPDEALRLVEQREPEMGAQLQRTDAQSSKLSTLDESAESRTLRKAQRRYCGDGDLRCRHRRRGCEPGVREERKGTIVECNPSLAKPRQQLIL
jgi:hypothetical protein